MLVSLLVVGGVELLMAAAFSLDESDEGPVCLVVVGGHMCCCGGGFIEALVSFGVVGSEFGVVGELLCAVICIWLAIRVILLLSESGCGGGGECCGQLYRFVVVVGVVVG